MSMRSMPEGHSCHVHGSGVIGAIAGRGIADYCGFCGPLRMCLFIQMCGQLSFCMLAYHHGVMA